MSQNTKHAEVIQILSHFDAQIPNEKTFLRQVSQPPKRLYFPTLLLMVIAVGMLMVAAMLTIQVPTPGTLGQSHPALITYGFQVPMLILIAGVLGQRLGTLCIFAYLLAGFAGLPIFAGGGGWQYLSSPTVGYLLGFLLVPMGIQGLLLRAFSNTGWFRGRTLWMASAALTAALVVHLSGLIGLGVHTLMGHLSWSQGLLWMQQLTLSHLPYDIAFGWIAAAAVRLTRISLYFCLY